MKKILAFLLAAVMVVGMGATAFAWDPTSTFVNVTESAPNTVPTKTLEYRLELSDLSLVGGTDYLPPNDEILSIDKAEENNDGVYIEDTLDNAIKGVKFTWRDEVLLATVTLADDIEEGDVLHGEYVIDVTATYKEGSSGTGPHTKTFQWILSLEDTVYQVAVDHFTDGEISAAITDFYRGSSLVDNYDVRSNGKITDADYHDATATGDWSVLNTGTMAPVDKPEVRFYLHSAMFKETVEAGILDRYIGRTGVDEAKMEVRVQTSKGSNALDGAPKISYDGGKAYVDVQFIEKWDSVDELKYDFYIYLVIDGKRMNKDGKGVRVYGTLNNDHIDVDDDDSFDGSYQEVAVAKTFNEDIRFDLGLGISIYTKFFKGKEYYGRAERAKDEAADVVMAAHPDIDNIVRLYTYGLNSTGDVVSFDTDWNDYYVYDEGYNLLGRSDERVPYRSVYYLANRPLDVDVDVEPVDPPVDNEVLPPAGTGGDMAPSNANANPGTGF